MAAGDTSVQISASGSVADIKTAVDAAITATAGAARITISQLNNGQIVVVANLIA